MKDKKPVYPDSHLYELNMEKRTVLLFSLAKNNPRPILTRNIKLSSGDKRANPEWFWLHQKEPDRWGIPSTSLKPLCRESYIYTGCIKIKDLDSLVIMSKWNRLQVFIDIYPGYFPASKEEFFKMPISSTVDGILSAEIKFFKDLL